MLAMQCSAGHCSMLRAEQHWALCSAGCSEALRAGLRCALCSAVRCICAVLKSRCKRAHLRKRFEACQLCALHSPLRGCRERFESLLHWQCFVERCAVPPLPAALGFSCEGLGSVAGGCRPRTPASRCARPSPAEGLLPRARTVSMFDDAN